MNASRVPKANLREKTENRKENSKDFALPIREESSKNIDSRGFRRLQLNFEQKRALLSVSLILVFVIAILFNGIWLLPEQENFGSVTASSTLGRQIASLKPGAGREQFIRNTRWEHEMAKSFSKEGQSKNRAALGRPPSKVDRLIFEQLSGNYSVALNTNGMLQEVRLADQSLDAQQLAFVNPKSFIQDNKEIIPGPFKTIEEISQSQKEENRLEVYALSDANGKKLAELHFEVDQGGRLLALVVKSDASN